MSAAVTTPTEVARDAGPALPELMRAIGVRARQAARALALTAGERKRAGLLAAAQAVREAERTILAQNALDLADAKAAGRPSAFLDRLALDPGRVAGIAEAIETIAGLPDPVGRVLARFERPNGLIIERVATPIGVVGVVFESRPNVTADAGALCLMAGNAAILRAGAETFRTASAIAAAMNQGLAAAGLPPDALQLVPTRDREAVGLMLGGLDGAIDVIIPRGGRSLVERVQAEARVPVFAHLDGIVHVYVDATADLAMAQDVVLNAKLRRTGICGAAEALLVAEDAVTTHLAPLVRALIEAGCEVRGDAAARAVDPRARPAAPDDWGREFLDAIIAVRVVDGLDAALDHIDRYGSRHTDAILTSDPVAAERFLHEVDSAIVLHNASTQFADGGEFGFGAEIGIATGRLHARGPVGVEQLTSFKYRLRGTGQTRP